MCIFISDTVKIVCEKLNVVDSFELESVRNCLRDVAKSHGLQFSKVMKTLRAVLSGLEVRESDGSQCID